MRHLVHLVAAMGLCGEEVGAEAFASRAYAEQFAALARFDPAGAVKDAGIGRLYEARAVATGLAGFGALLLMHGLLMPELAAAGPPLLHRPPSTR